MPDGVTFTRLAAADLLAIERQRSQATVLGIPGDIDMDEAATLAEQPHAWTARHQDRIVGCFGITEPFPGVQGVAWALLAAGIGRAHLALTRFAARELANSGLNRVEVLARCAATPEHFDHAAAMRWALSASRITPECRWAGLLGLRPAHVLHRYGAASETHMLFEWFGVPAIAAREAA
jgi:hypothetical protein